MQAFAAECDSVADIEEQIKTLFSDANKEFSVLLTSIHRCKGLERHTVICIPKHAPHPMARTKKALRQEFHLLYVQWTRAMDTLIIVDDPKMPFMFRPIDNPEDGGIDKLMTMWENKQEERNEQAAIERASSLLNQKGELPTRTQRRQIEQLADAIIEKRKPAQSAALLKALEEAEDWF